MTTAFDNPELFAAILRQSVPVSAHKRRPDILKQKFYISFRVDGAYERMNITKERCISPVEDSYMEAEFYIPYMFKFTCRFALNRQGSLDASKPFLSSDLKLINKTTLDDAEHYLTMARLNS